MFSKGCGILVLSSWEEVSSFYSYVKDVASSSLVLRRKCILFSLFDRGCGILLVIWSEKEGSPSSFFFFFLVKRCSVLVLSSKEPMSSLTKDAASQFCPDTDFINFFIGFDGTTFMGTLTGPILFLS